MKKFFLIILGIIFAVLMTVFAGCDMLIVDIKNIEIIEQPEQAVYGLGEFNYDDYTILVTYTDGKTETKKLDASMLSEYDNYLLNTVGTHDITILYDGFKVGLRIKIDYKQVDDDEEKQIEKPYLSDIDTVYDGTTKIVKVEGDIPENATVYYPNGQSFTDAGTYNVLATIVADGYETINLSAKVVIRKAKYDLSGIKLVVDYGVDENNNPLSSFVYDGAEHSATLVGDIPQGLTGPEFLIGLRNKPVSSYVSGVSAKDAGRYVVIARFTGDTKNYNVDNLDVKTDLVIDKQPIRQEGFEEVSYPIKYVDYDGLPHRYVIDDLKLPEGVSIEYLDENGKQFGDRIDANEDGYKITAKFVSSNSNYDLTNAIDLVLVIRRVAFKVDQKEINVGFDGINSINYDGNEHIIDVNGLVDGITVKTLSVNGEEKRAVKDAGTYEVYVEFNPFNQNYLPIDPISTTLTINKIAFTSISYKFESKPNEVYDELAHGLEYESYTLPIGVSVDFSYTTDKDFNTHAGIPDGIFDVGTYVCIGKYTYNKENYISAPDTLDDIVATLTISPRVYDATSIINLEPIRTSYKPGENQISLCSFTEKLPTWVTSYRVLVYPKDSSLSTKTVIDAGDYEYEYQFFYFNGIENTSAKSNKASFKVVGETVNSTNYKVSYTSTGTYDGVTSCLPKIELFFNEEDNAKATLQYYFQTFDSDNSELVAEADRVEVSKSAGIHTFVYEITAKNFEPYKRTYTVVVNRLQLIVDHNYYSVSNYNGIYDGKKHDNQITVLDGYKDSDIIEACPKIINASKEGLINGKDVGVYEYTIDFKSKDSNIELIVDNFYSFNYTVNITSIEMEKPNEFVSFSLDNSATSKKITVASTEPFYTSLSKFLGIENQKSITTDFIEFTGTYSLIGHLLSINVPTKEANAVEHDSFINGTNEELNISYVLYNKNAKTVDTYSNIDDLNNAMQTAGTYLVIVKFATDNIVVNGLSGMLCNVVVDAQSIELSNPYKESIGEITSKSSETFSFAGEGISMLTGEDDEVDEVASFEGALMLNFHENYFGSKLIVDLESNLSSDVIADIGAKLYLIKVTRSGEIITSKTTFNSIFTINNGDFLTSYNSQVTESGTYYVFVDLGINYIYQQNRRIVYKIDIVGVEVKITDIVDVFNKDDVSATTYDENNFRKYIIEKEKFVCALENNSPVANADNVLNATGYSGTEIYTFSIDFNSGLYKLKFFGGSFSQDEIKDVKMDVIFAGYSVIDGGKTLSTLSTETYLKKSNITIEELKETVSGLYLSNSQKAYTPVGVYYLFITFESGDLLVKGSDKVAVCIQVNRSSDSKYYTYSYGGKTYSYLTDGLVAPFNIKFVDNQYTYSINSKAGIPLEDKIISISSDSTEIQTANILTLFTATNTFNNIKIQFNQEEYGGWVCSMSKGTAKLYYEKRTIDLDATFGTKKITIKTSDNGTPLKYNGTAYNLNAGRGDFEGNIRKYFEDQLISIGVDKLIAEYFSKNYVTLTYGKSYQFYVGTYGLSFYVCKVPSASTDDATSIKNFFSSIFNYTYVDKFVKQGSSDVQYMFNYTKQEAVINISIAKREIYVTRYVDNSGSYNESTIKTLGLDSDYCLSTAIFTGYYDENYKESISAYTSGDNLFLSCVVTDSMNKLNSQDFINNCVKITQSGSNSVSVSINLGSAYSKYYQIVERKVSSSLMTESGFTNKGSSYTVTINYEG